MRILKVSQHITDDKKFPLHMEFGNVRAHFIDLIPHVYVRPVNKMLL